MTDEIKTTRSQLDDTRFTVDPKDLLEPDKLTVREEPRPINEILRELQHALRVRHINPEFLEIVLPGDEAQELATHLKMELQPDTISDYVNPRPHSKLCHRTVGHSYHIPNVVAIVRGLTVTARPY